MAFDMEKIAKLSQMVQMMQINSAEIIAPIHSLFIVGPNATIYEIVRAILIPFFVVYVMFKGFLMNHSKINILMHAINYIFFAYIWPIFFVYFAFMLIIPSPTYQIW